MKSEEKQGKYNNMEKVRVMSLLPAKTVTKIDEVRGYYSRSQFMQIAVDRLLESMTKGEIEDLRESFREIKEGKFKVYKNADALIRDLKSDKDGDDKDDDDDDCKEKEK